MFWAFLYIMQNKGWGGVRTFNPTRLSKCLKNADNIKRYIFLFSRIERNFHGQKGERSKECKNKIFF